MKMIDLIKSKELGIASILIVIGAVLCFVVVRVGYGSDLRDPDTEIAGRNEDTVRSDSSGAAWSVKPDTALPAAGDITGTPGQNDGGKTSVVNPVIVEIEPDIQTARELKAAEALPADSIKVDKATSRGAEASDPAKTGSSDTESDAAVKEASTAVGAGMILATSGKSADAEEVSVPDKSDTDDEGMGERPESVPEADAEDGNATEIAAETDREDETVTGNDTEAGEGSETLTETGENSASGVDQAQVDAYFKNCVFTGDSVLLGFRNYCRSADKPFSDILFLAAGSYSLHNAFWDVSSKSVHPLYQGEQRQLWDSVGIIQPAKLFMFFGINDMAYGIESSVEKYEELIGRIKENAPDTDIVILSATYTLEGAGGSKLNNTNLAAFNETMKQKAADNGWGFVDLANPLSDGKGNLKPEYCSDGELHENHKAYDIWVQVLSGYACTDTRTLPGTVTE